MIDPPLVSTRPHFMVTLYECIVFMHTLDMLILYTFYMGAHLKENHCCPLLNKMYSNVGNIPVLNVHIS